MQQRRLLTSVVLTALAGCATPPGTPPNNPSVGPATANARHARAAWERRADRDQLELAIASWEALAAKRADPEVLVPLARAYVFLGEVRAAEGAEPAALAEAYDRAVRAGEAALLASSPAFAERIAAGAPVEEALDLLPADAVGAVYWYAASLSGYALAKGLTPAIYFHGRIVALLSYVIARDEKLEHAGAHRTLGTYYAKAPAAAGGDLAKARVHFERALAVAAGFAGNKLALAEHYATSALERELFSRLLREVAAGPTDRSPEGALARARAARLLEQADELF